MGLDVSLRLKSGEYTGNSVEMGVAFNMGGHLEMNPEADWDTQKITYGRQVLMTVADGMIPHLLVESGGDGSSPAGKNGISVHCNLHNKSGTRIIGDHMLNVWEQVSGTIRLQGDRDMSVRDIVFTARDLIAAAIAESVLFALEHRLEGKQTNNTSMNVNRKNGEIIAIERTERPQDGGGRRPTPGTTRRNQPGTH